MERKITNELLRWKKDAFKPLLLYGAKQVGKTYTVLDFGKKNYKNVVYFNTDNYKELIDITEWTAEYRLIFRDGDKYYSCYYSEGLNDQVDIHPFDDEKDFIKCFEVKKKTVMVEDWVDVFEE